MNSGKYRALFVNSKNHNIGEFPDPGLPSIFIFRERELIHPARFQGASRGEQLLS
jgi:hypothetical protein